MTLLFQKHTTFQGSLTYTVCIWWSSNYTNESSAAVEEVISCRGRASQISSRPCLLTTSSIRSRRILCIIASSILESFDLRGTSSEVGRSKVRRVLKIAFWQIMAGSKFEQSLSKQCGCKMHQRQCCMVLFPSTAGVAPFGDRGVEETPL